MSENIQDFEKIYIYDYLNERKNDIINLLKRYNISYFKRDSGRSLFFNKNDKIVLRAFYSTDDKYVSIDEYFDEKLYDSSMSERIRLVFDKLDSFNLWRKGVYFKFIIDSLLKVKGLPIKVR